MKSTYNVAQARAQFPRVVRQAESNLVTITRRDEAVAFLVGRERMEAILETMEILANPEAMKWLRAAKAGQLKYRPLAEIEGDLDAKAG
jgi:antitoxin YefM